MERGRGVAHEVHQNGPKWSPYHDRAKVFWICLEWLIWSSSGLNGHLKGNRSQYKSWRGHGVTHEMHQNALKCTKMHQNGHHLMTEQNCFEFVLSDLYDLFLDWMDTWKGIGARTSHGGILGSHMRCTKMHQNEPKWSPYHDRAKVFWICPEWLKWSFFWLKWTLERG